jgi:hypothetical protein
LYRSTALLQNPPLFVYLNYVLYAYYAENNNIGEKKLVKQLNEFNELAHREFVKADFI